MTNNGKIQYSKPQTFFLKKGLSEKKDYKKVIQQDPQKRTLAVRSGSAPLGTQNLFWCVIEKITMNDSYQFLFPSPPTRCSLQSVMK